MKFDVNNLTLIRQKMKKEGLKSFLVVTGDPHNSEQPAPCYKEERLFACPFTGDNAEVLITEDEAFLWTDGRFFISAEVELDGSGIELMKKDTAPYPSLCEYIKNRNLYPVGTNLSVMTSTLYEQLSKFGTLIDTNLRDIMPAGEQLSTTPLMDFDKEEYQKYSKEEKVEYLRKKIKEDHLDGYLFSTLDDVAWITNLRGDDIDNTPLFYSYLFIDDSRSILFVNKDRVKDIDMDMIQVMDYDELPSFLESIKDEGIGIEYSQINAKVRSILKNSVDKYSYASKIKCVKNDVEITNIISVQEEDGAALVKFIYYLYNHLGEDLNEYDLAKVLQDYRKEGKRYIEDSFETICACGPNAAMMHYEATKDSFAKITKDTIELLVDSGGQYYGGTTDTTRTFLIGKPTPEFIKDYTLTLKSVIALSSAVFIDGTTGETLDMLARNLMWKNEMDYKSGTGHGVGYLSVVHERPNSFRYKKASHSKDSMPNIPGMITTVEPGVYKKDKYGIRIENNVLTVPAFENDDGKFYKFKTITYVPIDLKAVDLKMLTAEEISWINHYHEDVYEHLKSYFEGDMLEFLRYISRPVGTVKRVALIRKSPNGK